MTDYFDSLRGNHEFVGRANGRKAQERGAIPLVDDMTLDYLKLASTEELEDILLDELNSDCDISLIEGVDSRNEALAEKIWQTGWNVKPGRFHQQTQALYEEQK